MRVFVKGIYLQVFDTFTSYCTFLAYIRDNLFLQRDTLFSTDNLFYSLASPFILVSFPFHSTLCSRLSLSLSLIPSIIAPVLHSVSYVAMVEFLPLFFDQQTPTFVHVRPFFFCLSVCFCWRHFDAGARPETKRVCSNRLFTGRRKKSIRTRWPTF